MPLNTTTGANILKNRYIGPIRNQLQTKKILLNRVEREKPIMVSGKNITVPLKTSRNTAAAVGRPEGGLLPTPGQTGYDVAIIPLAYIYSTFKVSGQIIRAARDSAGAFVTAIDSEVQSLVEATNRAYNRQLHSDGTDALAHWTVAANVSPTVLDDGRGNAFVQLPPSGTITCDLIDATNNTTVIGNDIVVTRGVTNPATVSASWTGTVAGSDDGDYLVQQDTLGYQNMGIAGIISDANPPLLPAGLHGLDVATKPFWKANVLRGATPGTAEALTITRMQKVFDLILENSPYEQKDVEFLLGNTGVLRAYQNIVIQDKRHVNTLKLDGGWAGPEFNGVPLIVDTQCKRNRLYYIVPDCLRFFESSDFDWIDRDTGNMLHQQENEDAYVAAMFKYSGFGTTCRNGNGLLDDIIEG